MANMHSSVLFLWYFPFYFEILPRLLYFLSVMVAFDLKSSYRSLASELGVDLFLRWEHIVLGKKLYLVNSFIANFPFGYIGVDAGGDEDGGRDRGFGFGDT